MRRGPRTSKNTPSPQSSWLFDGAVRPPGCRAAAITCHQSQRSAARCVVDTLPSSMPTTTLQYMRLAASLGFRFQDADGGASGPCHANASDSSETAVLTAGTGAAGLPLPSCTILDAGTLSLEVPLLAELKTLIQRLTLRVHFPSCGRR